MGGAGLQTWGAFALAVAFYIIGLPTSAYLALDTDTGLLGLTLGNALGLFVAAASMACRIVWVHWEGVIKNASASADLTESLQKDAVADAPESSDAQRSIRLEACPRDVCIVLLFFSASCTPRFPSRLGSKSLRLGLQERFQFYPVSASRGGRTAAFSRLQISQREMPYARVWVFLSDLS